MEIEKLLCIRSNSKCELCSAENDLSVYGVPPESKATMDDSILLCEVCIKQIEEKETIDINHWRCLNDSMWSQVPAVQVMVWRMLTQLKDEGWPQELLETLYLDEKTLSWAQATGEGKSTEDEVKHLDSNGALLEAGDTVTLIKDLRAPLLIDCTLWL
ncbi:Protein PhnA [hydrothermal vent metagenome]|uniref:Protein PhnA n=1 Tax=hydrothermal vent metagenome TaxID=652676 RepID=A0A3B0WU37_9ZZZZ